MATRRDIILRLRAENQARRALRSVGNDLRDVEREAEAAADKLQVTGAALLGIAGGIATATGGLIAGIALMTLETSKFDRQLELARTQADDTRISLQFLQEASREIAREVPGLADIGQIPETLFTLFSTLHPTMEETIDLTRLMSQASVAGNTEIETTSRAAMQTMNAWGMAASDLEHVFDQQFATVQRGTMVHQDYVQHIGQIIPAARAAGQETATMNGALAFLTRLGLRPAMAATSTARAFELLARQPVAEKLEEIGVKVHDSEGNFRDFTDVMLDMASAFEGMTEPEVFAALDEIFAGQQFRIQARRFLQLAVQNAQLFADITDDIADSAGFFQERFDIVANTVDARADQLRNTFRVLRMEIGDEFQGILASIIGTGTRFINFLIDLDRRADVSIGKILGWLVVIGAFSAAIFAAAGVILLLQSATLRLGRSFGGLLRVIFGGTRGLWMLFAGIQSIVVMFGLWTSEAESLTEGILNLVWALSDPAGRAIAVVSIAAVAFIMNMDRLTAGLVGTATATRQVVGEYIRHGTTLSRSTDIVLHHSAAKERMNTQYRMGAQDQERFRMTVMRNIQASQNLSANMRVNAASMNAASTSARTNAASVDTASVSVGRLNTVVTQSSPLLQNWRRHILENMAEMRSWGIRINQAATRELPMFTTAARNKQQVMSQNIPILRSYSGALGQFAVANEIGQRGMLGFNIELARTAGMVNTLTASTQRAIPAVTGHTRNMQLGAAAARQYTAAQQQAFAATTAFGTSVTSAVAPVGLLTASKNAAAGASIRLATAMRTGLVVTLGSAAAAATTASRAIVGLVTGVGRLLGVLGLLNPKFLLVTAIIWGATHALSNMGQRAREEAQKIEELSGTIDSAVSGFSDFRDILSGTNDAVRDFVVSDLQDQFSDVNLDDFNVSLRGATDAVFGHGDALGILNDQLDEVESRIGFWDKYREVAIILPDAEITRHRDAIQDIIDVLEDQSNMLDDSVESYLDWAEAMGGSQGALAELVRELDRLEFDIVNDNLDEFIETLLDGDRESRELGRRLRELSEEASELAPNIEDMTRNMGLSEQEAALMSETMDDTAESASLVSEAVEELSTKLGEFIGPAQAFSEMMKDLEDEAQEAAEAAADAHNESIDRQIDALEQGESEQRRALQDQKKNWEDFVEDVVPDINLYIDKLEEQVEAQQNWASNLVLISATAGEDIARHLADLGPEAAPLVAEFVNASEEEIERLRDILPSTTEDSVNLLAEQLEAAFDTVPEVAGRLGEATISELLEAFAEGELDIPELISQLEEIFSEEEASQLEAKAKQFIGPSMTAIEDSFDGTAETANERLSEANEALSSTGVVAGELEEDIESLDSTFSSFTETVGTWATDTFTAFREWHQETGERLREWTTETLSSIDEWGREAHRNFRTWLTGTWNSVDEWGRGLHRRVNTWLDTTTRPMLDFIESIERGISNLIEGFTQGIIEFFTPTGESIEQFTRETLSSIDEWGRDVHRSFRTWLSNTWNEVDEWGRDARQRFLSWISDTWSDIDEWGRDTHRRFREWTSDTWSEIDEWGRDTHSTFTTWVSDTWSDIDEWGRNTHRRFREWAADTGDTVDTWERDTKDSIFEWISDTFNAFREWHIDVGREFRSWVGETSSQLIGWISDLGPRFETWTEEVAANFVSWARRSGRAIDDWVTDSASAIGSWISSQFSAFREFWIDTGRGFREMWGGIIGGIVSAANTGISTVETFLNNVISGINDLIGLLNNIPGVDISDIGSVSLPRVGGGTAAFRGADRFHEGGIVPGHRGQEVGAILQAGEGVLPVDTMDRLGKQNFEQLREAETNTATFGKEAGGFNLDFFTELMDAGQEWASSRLEQIIDNFAGVLLASEMGSWVVDATKGLARQAADGIKDMIWGDEGLFGGGPGPALTGGIGWRAMWAAVQAQFPWARLTSAFRPGAITATGNPSYHGMGRAIDVAGRGFMNTRDMMMIAQWIRANYMAATRELIFSPMGPTQIHNGRNHMYRGITRAMHFDHVHWAMEKGGIVTGPTRALIGEAGPEAVIPLDRLGSMTPRERIELHPSTELNRLLRLERGTGFSEFLAFARAFDDLADAHDNVRRLNQEIRENQQHVRSLRVSVASLREQYELVAQAPEDFLTPQQELAFLRQKERVSELREELKELRNIASGRIQLSLSDERDLIRQRQRVKELAEELKELKAIAAGDMDMTPQEELDLIRQKRQVKDLRDEYERLQNAEPDPDALARATENLERAQVSYKDAVADTAAASAQLKEAEFEVARIAEKAAHFRERGNEVQALLLEFKAENQLADAKRALADAEEAELNSKSELTEAQDELNQVIAEGEVTADELREAELQLIIAEQQLEDMQRERTITSDELRLAEIDLKLAQQDLEEMEKQRTVTSDELRMAQLELKIAEEELGELREARLTEISDELRQKEDELSQAKSRGRELSDELADAEWRVFEATLSLMDATSDLGSMTPEAVDFFKQVARSAGLATSRINEMIQTVSIGKSAHPAVAKAQASGARFYKNPSGHYFLRTSAGQWYAATGTGQVEGLKALFGSARSASHANIGVIRGNVVDLFGGPGGIEDVIAGARAMPKLARGAIVRARPGGTPVIVGEGGRDEAVVPLDDRVSGTTKIEYKPTYHIRIAADVDSESVRDKIQEQLEEHDREFVEFLRSQ